MFTSKIRELLGTKIQVRSQLNVVKYSQTMNTKAAIYIASLKELGSISGNMNLKHTIGIPIYQLLNKVWTSLSLMQ